MAHHPQDRRQTRLAVKLASMLQAYVDGHEEAFVETRLCVFFPGGGGACSTRRSPAKQTFLKRPHLLGGVNNTRRDEQFKFSLLPETMACFCDGDRGLLSAMTAHAQDLAEVSPKCPPKFLRGALQLDLFTGF